MDSKRIRQYTTVAFAVGSVVALANLLLLYFSDFELSLFSGFVFTQAAVIVTTGMMIGVLTSNLPQAVYFFMSRMAMIFCCCQLLLAFMLSLPLSGGLFSYGETTIRMQQLFPQVGNIVYLIWSYGYVKKNFKK